MFATLMERDEKEREICSHAIATAIKFGDFEPICVKDISILFKVGMIQRKLSAR